MIGIILDGDFNIRKIIILYFSFFSIRWEIFFIFSNYIIF